MISLLIVSSGPNRFLQESIIKYWFFHNFKSCITLNIITRKYLTFLTLRGSKNLLSHHQISGKASLWLVQEVLWCTQSGLSTTVHLLYVPNLSKAHTVHAFPRIMNYQSCTPTSSQKARNQTIAATFLQWIQSTQNIVN